MPKPTLTYREDGYVLYEEDGVTYAYPGDKFNNLEALEKEVEKKKAWMSARAAKKTARKTALTQAFERKHNGGN